MNQLKAGAILSYVSLGLSNVIGLIYTPFMLRMMGQSEYGLYSLVASVVAYLTVLDFGFGNAIIRYTAKFRAEGKVEEQYSMFGMFILLYSAIGVLAFLAGLGLYFNVDTLFGKTMTSEELDKAQLMMLLLVFNIAVTFPLSIFGAIITAYENFIFQKVVRIIRLLLNPIVMTILLLLGYRAIGLVIATTILNITTLLINYFYCVKRLKVKIVFSGFDSSFLKEIFTFSVYAFLIVLFEKFYWTFGQVLVGSKMGTTDVAKFSVAMQLRGFLAAFSWALTDLLLPKLTYYATNYTDMKPISNLFIKVGRIQTILISFIISGFYLFGERFIVIWAGTDYVSVYNVCMVLFIASAFLLCQSINYSMLQALNKQRVRLFASAIVFVIDIILSIYLIDIYGLLGCALALLISLFIGEIIIMNRYYYKLGIDILGYWKDTGGIVLMYLFLSLFIKHAFGDLINSLSVYYYILILLGYIVTVIFLLYFFVFNIEEKRQVRFFFIFNS